LKWGVFVKRVRRALSPYYRKYLSIKEDMHLYADTMRLIRIAAVKRPKIFYFGIVEHSNLGDMGQYYCIRRWIEDNFPGFPVHEFAATTVVAEKFGFLDKLERALGPEDIIIFQSGYTTQDLGGVHDLMHRVVIERFPNAKILMMPQTIYFKSKERKALTAKIYNLAKRMLFLARDKVSLKMAREMFPDVCVMLFPDIVTTLIGKYRFASPRSGILLCCRDDVEKHYRDEELKALSIRLSALVKTDFTDTTINVPHRKIKRDISSYLEREFERFARYRLIITDRFHGMVFALIANTPVIVLKTRDHKVTTGAEWLKSIYNDSVHLAESLDEAYSLAERLLNGEPVQPPASYFKEAYYDRLKEIAVKLWSGSLEPHHG
jgi:exopolysaccharide biosynthesis predicted pyruvyltransferase EpsI